MSPGWLAAGESSKGHLASSSALPTLSAMPDENAMLDMEKRFPSRPKNATSAPRQRFSTGYASLTEAIVPP